MITQMDNLLELINQSGGVITAKQVTDAGISRSYLTRLKDENVLIHIRKGLYATPEIFVDDMYEIQVRSPFIVFSHLSALFIHDLTDRTPLKYTITLPINYNATHMRDMDTVEMKFSKNEIYSLGITNHLSPAGFPIKVYDIEKTICDVVRTKKNMDSAVVVDALKRFARLKNKDLSKLMEYAKILRIESKMRDYMEVLI